MNQETVHTNLIHYKSFFWSPDYGDPSSAWTEHIPFAFWFIEVVRPKTIVELGVHGAASYFSFCQAIKTLDINTVCYGIDTWQGDEHSGFYTEEIFQKVSNYNAGKFSRFSTLIRSTFDEAKNYFIDGSIELLHIDGLHTYEAVKHDFEVWLPKLSADGYIIFHDINVRERNFGVFKLWEELKDKYAHFQFDFGHGLGVLAVGKIEQDGLGLLFNKNEAYTTFLRNLFSERGNFFKSKMHNEAEIAQKTAQLDGRREALESDLARLNGDHEKIKIFNADLIAGKKELEAGLTQLKESLANVQLTNSNLIANNQQLTEAEHSLQEQVNAHKLNNRQLEQKYKNELKMSGDEFSAVRAENEIFKKNILWYQSTYETRSILGVLKTKISSLFKKKISFENVYRNTSAEINSLQIPGAKGLQTQQNTQKNYYYLNPANDLELTDEGVYSVIGPDPFFLVDFRNKRIRAGWYLLCIEITEKGGKAQSPTLYFDYGNDFNEEEIWNLPQPKNGMIRCLIKFRAELKQLRFDPTKTAYTFWVKELYLKPTATIKAFRIAVSMQKDHDLTNPGHFTGYAELGNTLIKTGFGGIRKRLWGFADNAKEKQDEKYTDWCALFDTVSKKEFDFIRSLSNDLTFYPLFSIIMPVFNAPVQYLKKAIASVENQAYPNWELCIAEDKSTNEDVRELLKEYEVKDKRIKVIFRQTNGHISEASNSALELATGDYIVLMDQDDELPLQSLYMVAKAIEQNRALQLIYSDEDKIDEQGNRFDPYFKTDWNRELFYGQNMISHLGVYRKSLVERAGGFKKGYEGSQDYDLALRCIEHLRGEQIHHIPHVLYHWRAIKGSTAVSVSNKNYAFDAGLKALNDHLKRTNQPGKAEQNINNSYRIKWELPDPAPKVSIIIPTRDNVNVLTVCITSLLQNTSYTNYEILIIDNDSQESSTIEYLNDITQKFNQVKVYTYNGAFNFSAIINYGVRQSTGKVILLLNNDTETINADWLTEMVSQCMRQGIGAVGAKLYYPNGSIQHAGVFLYNGHPGNHIYLGKTKDDPGYFNKLNLVQNYVAVTAACLAVRKELFMEVNGFDEENLKVAYNDVDFCLKLRELDYRNVWTPFAQLVHHESLSRGNDLDETNFTRFEKERNYMLEKWKDLISQDPYFNPNLGHDTRINQLAFPPRLMYEWRQVTVHEAIKE